MSQRALQVLRHFPAHLDAAREDKLTFIVADAVSRLLDVSSAELAGVRRSHRLAHADTQLDVRRIAALHAIGVESFLLLRDRRRLLAEAESALKAAADADARRAAAQPILELFGVPEASAALELFSEASDTELERAAEAMGERLAGLRAHGSYLEAARSRVACLCSIGAVGNGTLRALIEAAANALDLDLDAGRNQRAVEASERSFFGRADGLVHARNRFVHASYVTERFALARLVQTPLPEKLLAVFGPVVLVEAAAELGLEPTLLLGALRELEIPIVRADATLDLETLGALSEKLGFELELRGKGRLEMGARIALGALAALARIPSAELVAELARQGYADLDANSQLSGELAALAVRSRGFELLQRLEAEVGQDLIGIEENPFRDQVYESPPLVHGQRFNVLRRGFSRRGLSVRIKGIGGFTLGPMLVNLDEGRGIGFAAAVADGDELVFDSKGAVRRKPSDELVTGYAFSWSGACFADVALPHVRDFTFALEDGTGPGRPAHFAVATPAGALDREMVFPHAETELPMPGIRVGETRFAFFVERATFGSRDPDLSTRTATPRTSAGLLAGPGSELGSGFAPAVPPKAVDDPHPDSDWEEPLVGQVTLEWREREAYALRLLIPDRFDVFDGGETPALAAVRAALERVRPAGVELRVEYIDETWTLGNSDLPGGLDADPTSYLLGGTVLTPLESPPA